MPKVEVTKAQAIFLAQLLIAAQIKAQDVDDRRGEKMAYRLFQKFYAIEVQRGKPRVAPTACK